MNRRTHPIVDPILAVLAMLMVLALAMAGGCAVVPPGRTVAAYSLINFAPSIKLQIGGSDARVDVNNEQNGDKNSITKETPIQARVDAATDLKVPVTP